MAKIKKVPLIRIDRSAHMFISPPGRLSFPHLFTPTRVEENQEPSFSCDIIFNTLEEFKQPYVGKKTSTPSIAQCIQNVKRDQWGENSKKWPNFTFKNIKKGNEKTYDNGEILQGYKDAFYMTLRTGHKYPPRLYNVNGSPATPEDLYGGCYVRVQVLCRPYITPLACGVSLRLLAVMKTAEGQPFGLGSDMFDFDGDEEHGAEETENEFDVIQF